MNKQECARLIEKMSWADKCEIMYQMFLTCADGEQSMSLFLESWLRSVVVFRDAGLPYSELSYCLRAAAIVVDAHTKILALHSVDAN